MQELINMRDVDIGYSREKKLILSVNLKILENDFVIINGKNGSGKSTLLKLLYMKKKKSLNLEKKLVSSFRIAI